jgi:hypothetical protein
MGKDLVLAGIAPNDATIIGSIRTVCTPLGDRKGSGKMSHRDLIGGIDVRST